jgi:hypothetical protein
VVVGVGTGGRVWTGDRVINRSLTCVGDSNTHLIDDRYMRRENRSIAGTTAITLLSSDGTRSSGSMRGKTPAE